MFFGGFGYAIIFLHFFDKFLKNLSLVVFRAITALVRYTDLIVPPFKKDALSHSLYLQIV